MDHYRPQFMTPVHALVLKHVQGFRTDLFVRQLSPEKAEAREKALRDLRLWQCIELRPDECQLTVLGETALRDWERMNAPTSA
jgi:hypothetical protein